MSYDTAMKSYFLFAFIFVFLANIMVASVWAMPCVMDKDLMSQQIDINKSAEMPCHIEQEKTKKDEDQNCDDLCLCLNVLVSQTPIFNSCNFSITAVSPTHFSIRDEKIASIILAPLFRPPITLS